MTDLPDRFDFAATEPEIYRAWIDAGCFNAHAEASVHVGGTREPYTIVMPPPNVTAILHVGHGLNNSIQDVIIRWARMRGAEALWVPGTDHAGIATQNVVEKLVASEGKTRFDLGREAFVKRTEAFVAETGGVILQQLRAIGASADWSRTAYTLSPELSRRRARGIRAAVRTRFDLSRSPRDSLVPALPHVAERRGSRVPRRDWANCTTSRIRWTGIRRAPLVIATTRPETMLGDVAVAVNPEDDRYRDLVGKFVRLPIVDRPIPVIADAYADPAFGTGVVKITPAHDANDFEVGRRHSLPMPVVIDEHGDSERGRGCRGARARGDPAVSIDSRRARRSSSCFGYRARCRKSRRTSTPCDTAIGAIRWSSRGYRISGS